MTNLLFVYEVLLAYQALTLPILLNEAEHFVKALPLPTCPPLVQSNLVVRSVARPNQYFGGVVGTTNYRFGFGDGFLHRVVRTDLVPKESDVLAFYHSLTNHHSQIGSAEALVIATQAMARVGIDLEALLVWGAPKVEQRWVVARPMGDREEITKRTPKLDLPWFTVRWSDVVEIEVLGTTKEITQFAVEVGIPRLRPMLNPTCLSPTAQWCLRRRNHDGISASAAGARLKLGSSRYLKPAWPLRHPKYRTTFLPLLLAEAGWVAERLELGEDLPLQTNGLVRISLPLAYSAPTGWFQTSNYSYSFHGGWLHSVQAANPVAREEFLQPYHLELSRQPSLVDTNEAIRLARQVLDRFGVDRLALERKSGVLVEQAEVLERPLGMGEVIPLGAKRFKVPVFSVRWGNYAEVEVLGTNRKITYLWIHPWISLRSPVVVPPPVPASRSPRQSGP
jgi:hypothetical protein